MCLPALVVIKSSVTRPKLGQHISIHTQRKKTSHSLTQDDGEKLLPKLNTSYCHSIGHFSSLGMKRRSEFLI